MYPHLLSCDFPKTFVDMRKCLVNLKQLFLHFLHLLFEFLRDSALATIVAYSAITES